MKVAIVGSGIAGLGAAYALKDVGDVTVFEAEDRVGGHSYTINTEINGRAVPVDIGFIVYNPLNYPNLCGLFEAIGAPTKPSDMSFGLSAGEGFEWSSNPSGLFARKRNLVRPRFVRFLREILQFNDTAVQAVQNESIGDISFGQWLSENGFSDDLKTYYILPMGAAIWSSPEARIMDYPASSFLNFFNNHRLLHRERPKWRTVDGGSQAYVSRLSDQSGATVRTRTAVRKVSKSTAGDILVSTAEGNERYDHVILACHSDQSAKLLDRDTLDERAFPLGSIRYQPNRVVLHRDPALMPKRKASWASWNVIRTESGRLCLSYWMNLLQNVDSRTPVFVTLNPELEPREDLKLFETNLDHPLFDLAASAAVRQLKRDNGRDGLWFAGAWMGHGFHEDGLKAGLSAALSIGGSVPWTPESVEIYSPEQALVATQPNRVASSHS